MKDSSDYPNRRASVPDCIQLNASDAAQFKWLPPTCAYRLVAEGRDLYWWHPLVSGDRDSVHRAAMSVRGRALPEDDVGDPLSHLADWIDAEAPADAGGRTGGREKVERVRLSPHLARSRRRD